jgi:hypothetical protein
MRFYKTEGDSREGFTLVKWSGSQAAAASDRRALKEDGRIIVETTAIEVPTDKPGLLAWLNENVDGI